MNTEGILQYSVPCLRSVLPPVTDFKDPMFRLVADGVMTAAMAWGRLGVSANQLGLSGHRVFAARPKSEGFPRIFVNAELLNSGGEQIGPEGCLSVAERFFQLARPSWVIVQAQDIDGKQFQVTAEGLYARCLLHEMDHMNGVLVLDRVREQLPTMRRPQRRAVERELAKLPDPL